MNLGCVEVVCLPLYLMKSGEKYVQTNNGLNLWRAGGRVRHENEIEILIPEQFKLVFSSFFPEERDTFELRLPNYVTLSARISKDARSIQTLPGKAFGKWLLRQVLRITSGNIVTYEMLERKGIDAIYFEKWIEGKDVFYKVFPAPLGEYESFLKNGIKKRKEVPIAGSKVGSIRNLHLHENESVDDFNITEGDAIMHKAFGQGLVKSIDNDMIELDFDGTVKSFKYSWLINNRMITVG